MNTNTMLSRSRKVNLHRTICRYIIADNSNDYLFNWVVTFYQNDFENCKTINFDEF